MRIPFLFAIAIAAVFSSAPAVPQSFPVPDRRARLESAFGDVDRLFTDFIKTAHVPGAAWGVIIDGDLAHSGARASGRSWPTRQSTPTPFFASRR